MVPVRLMLNSRISPGADAGLPPGRGPAAPAGLNLSSCSQIGKPICALDHHLTRKSPSNQSKLISNHPKIITTTQADNNNTMMEHGSDHTAYQVLRGYLIASAQINTVEEFFRLDESNIKKKLINLVAEMGEFDGNWKHPRMTNLLATNNFEPYRPLITALLANEAKSDEEIRALINPKYNRRPPPLTFIPTPTSTGTLSSLVDSSNRLEDFLPALGHELRGLLYKDVYGLVNHFIDTHHVYPSLRPDESFIDLKYNDQLKDTSEASMLNWITSFFKHLDTKRSNIRYSRTWRSRPTTRLEGVDATSRLDGAIMSWLDEDEESYHVRDVLVPVELKNKESCAQDAVICLAKYVHEVFKAQPTRSFVVGFTLCGTSMQLWQFDRSGAIGSELVNIKENRENLKKFFNLMACFLTCNKALLGFDPTFEEVERRPDEIRIETRIGNETFVIDPPVIFRAPGICGRGTTCWTAHLPEDEHQRFLIKDSWQPTHWAEEGVMLRDVTEKKVPHVARYHHHEDVHVAGKSVDIESYVRRNLPTRETFNIAEQLNDPQAPHEYINRVHRRLILKDAGEPIHTVDSPVRLLEALEGCIKGHQALLNAGYLHRDISLNNLMVDNQTNDVNLKSFLIDLDVAIKYPIIKDEDRHARTGTKVFMSAGLLLQENSHNHLDDLESFFWVLIWICIHYPRDQRRPNVVTNWNQLDSTTLGVIKDSYLSNPHRLMVLFTPQYRESQPLHDCIATFAEIISSHHKNRNDEHPTDVYGEIVYGEILAILEGAKKELQEVEPLSQS
ncbi:hypothetical protein PCANC_11285 [Puccinia coronata f. sp. avenae]|uniref:Fungal-type protein kinase domain-containing protein n=1 Tax=Puccinia coronata f. sp. avenae TaxID=200324 RepID=A0A2N5V5C9_9BASI|nr:hypothetical protein PCANC_11285 [Puccinia coronata f. sp. avenae]